MPKNKKLTLPPLPIDCKVPIYSRLVQSRKLRGITQVELAKRIGITRDVLAGYESGRAHFNEDMVIRLCVALKISADTLLGLEKNDTLLSNPPNVRLTHRMYQIQQLPNTDQKAIIRTIDTFLKGSSTTKSLPGETP